MYSNQNTMILLVHMLFGAAIGATVQNPVLASVLALFGHYFLDLFPHIEYLESTEKSILSIKHGRWKTDGIKVFIDFFLAITIIFFISNNKGIIYVCALIAIIPDGLTVITHLFPNPLLKKHHQIHGGPIHYLTKQKNFPVFWKILSQVIFFAISISLLYRWR